MELKNHLGITNSCIIKMLIKYGFRYMSYANGENLGWGAHFLLKDYHIQIHCDFKNRKLSIFKTLYNKQSEEKFVLIPDELVEKDNWEEFINWLDEECEPYL